MSVGDPNIPITSDPKRICQGRPSDVLSGCLFEVYNGRPSDVYWVPIWNPQRTSKGRQLDVLCRSVMPQSWKIHFSWFFIVIRSTGIEFRSINKKCGALPSCQSSNIKYHLYVYVRHGTVVTLPPTIHEDLNSIPDWSKSGLKSSEKVKIKSISTDPKSKKKYEEKNRGGKGV